MRPYRIGTRSGTRVLACSSRMSTGSGRSGGGSHSLWLRRGTAWRISRPRWRHSSGVSSSRGAARTPGDIWFMRPPPKHGQRRAAVVTRTPRSPRPTLFTWEDSRWLLGPLCVARPDRGRCGWSAYAIPAEEFLPVTFIPDITLNNGRAIPQFGFGVFLIEPKDTVAAVSTALQAGYRHIDTAEMYGNEAEVGEAIARSGLDRGEVFVTSKLNNGSHAPDDAREAFDATLKALGFDYIDLFL